jgi:uncharacterized protein
MTKSLCFFTFLFAACSPVDKKASELVTAAHSGDLVLIEKLLREGTPVDARANDDWTPLTVAAREGHIIVVKYLLDKKAKVNDPEGGGNTALFWAAYNGHLKVVKLLIERGANPQAKCLQCNAPIDIAINRGHADVANYLRNVQSQGKLVTSPD